MKAIILAAGQGKRLRPLTKDTPKCLVELFGKPLLEWQVDTLRKCGILDISIVTGYKSDLIKNSKFKKYKNVNYASTNMVETLFCARKEMTGNVIVSYGDILYEKSILEKLIKSDSEISVIVDKNWEKYWKIRFSDPLDDAETLILDDDGFIQDLGQKPETIGEIQGQYIGLMKFQGKGLELVKNFYDEVRNEFEKTGTNLLNPKIDFEKSYMTDFIRGMIRNKIKVKAVPINNGWLEVDTINDYEKYIKKYNDNTLNQFFSPANT